jgi:SAM-dependent methyltransferase
VGEARYDRVADTYAIGPDDYSVPATRSLLEVTGEVAGLRLLDLACGHGLIAREMARRGAHVIGVDLSGRLLERARAVEEDDPLGITYIAADATSAATLSDESFDVVACNFGLSDIDRLDSLCANVARLLVVGGRFTFSLLHPCFPGVAGVSGSWPTGGRYYDEGWWRADGELSVLRREVGANHRMISTYLNAMSVNGLILETMAEPQPAEPWTEHRPGAEALPVYLVARCRRVEQAWQPAS